MNKYIKPIKEFMGDYKKRVGVHQATMQASIITQLEVFSSTEDQTKRTITLLEVFHVAMTLLIQCKFNLTDCHLNAKVAKEKKEISHDNVRRRLEKALTNIKQSKHENLISFATVSVAATCFNEIQRAGQDFEKLFNLFNDSKIDNANMPVADMKAMIDSGWPKPEPIVEDEIEVEL